jgi:hypothetical protein
MKILSNLNCALSAINWILSSKGIKSSISLIGVNLLNKGAKI